MRTDLGAAMTLQPDEIHPDDFAVVNMRTSRAISFNEALLRAVLAAAKEAGCTISLISPSSKSSAAGDTLREILRDSVDIVFANEEEAAAFTGLSDDYPAMARTLAELCSIAAVKIGAEGAWIASEISFSRCDRPRRIGHRHHRCGRSLGCRLPLRLVAPASPGRLRALRRSPRVCRRPATRHRTPRSSLATLQKEIQS